MSEGDVSMIRDEDLLRRMWQQTEDFTRKKEIRAHMYRLREERLRNLYSPEPSIEGKGCELRQTHVQSFADQNFQSLKSKEVRDAGSPPKEFMYRGQELKDLSNAGWNVESENKITNDGLTKVRSMNANIEGKYDVEDGHGQFSAIDQHEQAVTEIKDGNTNLQRDESTSKAAAHEEVFKKTDDGSHFSSIITSSSSSSKLQQISSVKDAILNDENEVLTSSNTKEYVDKNLNQISSNKNQKTIQQKTIEQGELISRKVDFPDENTKVVVETRCLPDGTNVTSTRREIRGSALQTSRTDKRTQETKSESNCIEQSSDNIKTSSRLSKESITGKTQMISKATNNESQSYNEMAYEQLNANNKVCYNDESKKSDYLFQEANHNHESQHKVDEPKQTEQKLSQTHSENYQTTYQSDYKQKKVSNDWSPSHQAWASTLRSDTPSTRGSSPSRNMSSTSSLRSSLSPDKTYRRPSSRSVSPNKADRYSSTTSDQYTSTSTNNISETTPSKSQLRSSISPEKRNIQRFSISPEKRIQHKNTPRSSPERKISTKNDTNTKINDSKKKNNTDYDLKQNVPGYMKQTITTDSKINSKLTLEKYKLIDEETKMYVGTNKDEQNYNNQRKHSPSPQRRFKNNSDSDFARPDSPLTSSLKSSRSPSPPKGPVTFTDEISSHKSRKTSKENSVSAHSKKYSALNTDDIHNDLLEHDLTINTAKDKYGDSINFISTEKTNEEKDKNQKSKKETTRKLVTPSTSPTRKNSTLTSTKQNSVLSSPTTSVSEFVYIDKTRNNTMVTDIDDYYHINSEEMNTNRRPESLSFKRSPSPIKLPAQSKTPDKKSPITNLPRKSSLKKPSNGFISPEERPPTTFEISPTKEEKEVSQFHVNKIDHPEKESKTKPPLERRETYEERCRKILGMVTDSTNIYTSECTENFNEMTTNKTLEYRDATLEDIVNTSSKKHTDVTDFINVERNDGIEKRDKKIDILQKDKYKNKNEYSSTDVSITKSNDIIVKETQENGENINTNTRTQSKRISLSRSPSPIKTAQNPKPRAQSPSKKVECESEFNFNNKEYQTVENAQNNDVDNVTTTVRKQSKRISISRSPSPSKLSKTPKLPSQSPCKSIRIECELNLSEIEQNTLNKSQKSVIRDKSTDQAKSQRIILSRSPSPLKTSETSKSRTQSPSKTVETELDYKITEREQQILEKVQNSLRKLSPERKSRSPSPAIKQNKTTTSLQDIDIVKKSETNIVSNNTDKISVERKRSESNIPTKSLSRNISPTKKPGNSKLTGLTKRSDSPQKHVYSMTRPAFPQVSKVNVVKSKDSLLNKPHSTGSISTTKLEKATQKLITKQSSLPKMSPTKISGTNKMQSINKQNKTPESDIKREVPKANKENVIPKKDTDYKSIKTTSDITAKYKKQSPQQAKTKPDIHVTDTAQKPKQSSNKIENSSKNRTTNLTVKPKSATALNTQVDENEIIINVEQAKSSRENSPDRICPTPVNFYDDSSSPRYPDEVSEPDDELQKRTHNIIHETEYIDDIIEISEDEEFDSESKFITKSDECLLSVNDKVSRFTDKIEKVTNTKDDICKIDNVDKYLKTETSTDKILSDECLLTVSEKVSKFANGSRESKSPSRNIDITNEFDSNTVFIDDHTKMSINDKATFFIESAENITAPKLKPCQKVERPDLSDLDEALRSDDCLLSVSDKVNKFVKTAEQYLNEKGVSEDKERITKEEHVKIMELVNNLDHINKQNEEKNNFDDNIDNTINEDREGKRAFTKETVSSHAKNKNYESPNLKPYERPTMKITTLRSSEAVKKAKALFENIASTTQKSTSLQTTKLNDVQKLTPKTDKTTDLSIPDEVSVKPDKIRHSEIKTTDRDRQPSKTMSNDNVLTRKAPALFEASKNKISNDEIVSSSHKIFVNTNENKNVPDSTKTLKSPVKNSQNKDERKDDIEVSTRRGSGKFGVELRRTSIEKACETADQRRSSDHYQPCIEDIYDVTLLEQMLEKVVGYEQRRRIRAQIRIAKKHVETNRQNETSNHINSARNNITTKMRSPDRRSNMHKPSSPERKHTENKPLLNGQVNEPKHINNKRSRPHSPEKPKPVQHAKSPTRPRSPEKRTSTPVPNKTSQKLKANRFNEYASAYMRKVGLNENERIKLTEPKIKTIEEIDHNETQNADTQRVETTTTITKSVTERSSSKDYITTTNMNGRKSTSPDKVSKPNDRVYHRSPSPDFKRRAEKQSKEPTIKATNKVYVEKKIHAQTPELEKPSWVTNRNLKKVTSDTRTYSSRKIEKVNEKRRTVSPSKVISNPTDVITSSYGIGPLGEDGKPLFGIKALRNGATNYQVRGTVVREEWHSTDGSAPTGTVSVTKYSSRPQELGGSSLHGLAALTTTRRFGGDSGVQLAEVKTKEERASIEQFTHHGRKVDSSLPDLDTHTYKHREESLKKEDRRSNTLERKSSGEKIVEVTGRESQEKEEKETRKMERREDRKTVRQSSVKSLTEKFIKNAAETVRNERISYPKAGLILRTTGLKDSFNSDLGLERTDSSHSMNLIESEHVMSSQNGNGQESFLRNNSKVTGVQDILTRMRNADIVVQDGDTCEDVEARALLNKFLGATVLMAGMQNYVTEGRGNINIKQESVTRTTNNSTVSQDFDFESCWDEKLLKKLLEESADYEERRKIRARLRNLMAEQEACADAVAAVLGEVEASADSIEAETKTQVDTGAENGSEIAREEEKVTTVTSSVRRNSSEKSVSSTTTSKSTKVIDSMTRPAPKPVSPFAKFRQLEKQNSTEKPRM